MIEKHVLTIREVEQMVSGDGYAGLKEAFPERCDRAGRFLFREDALRCMGAGILMKSVLGISEKDLGYGRFGKPFIRRRGGFAGCDASAPVCWEFNISHSGEHIVLATSDKPVGIDIEESDPRHMDMAEHVFTKEELEWMHGEQDRFYTLWTMKESLMKATGLGLNLPPASFSVMDGIRDGLLLHEGISYEVHWEKIGSCLMTVCEQIQEK